MSIQKLRISFAKYNDPALETKARQVLQSMTGNPAFPSPIPPLADLKSATDAYGIALVNATDLGRMNVAEKNKSRESLELLLGQLAMYVMYIANGDIAILTSSGFDLAKDREVAVLMNPGVVTLGNGISTGQMAVSVKAVKGAKGYLHQYTPEPVTADTQWISAPSSRSKTVFTGLLPGRQYFVRVAVVGNNEQVAYSPVASMFVQ